jgi:hypothetical protein
MADSNNLLDKIKGKRQRVSVEREDSLISLASLTRESEAAETAMSETSIGSTLAELKAELAKIPSTRRHSAIVLEDDLDRRLTQFCKDNRITVETFLEAAWILAEQDESVSKKILAEAQHRYTQRKEAGRLRRLITTLQKTTVR